MLFIFGTRRTVRQLAMVVLTCANCHRTAANAVLKMVTKFTLFFIPLFPVRTRYATQCTACGYSATIDKGQAQQLAQAPATGSGPGQQFGQQYGQPDAGQAPWTGGSNGHAAPGQYPGARGW
jgi:hypothetical protein